MAATNALHEAVLDALHNASPADLGIEEIPPCASPDGHDWAMEHDKTVTSTFLNASMTETFPAAQVCSHCGLVASLRIG